MFPAQIISQRQMKNVILNPLNSGLAWINCPVLMKLEFALQVFILVSK